MNPTMDFKAELARIAKSEPTPETALAYVLSGVLGERPVRDPIARGPFWLAFAEAGVTSINDFLRLDEADFKDIDFTELAATPDIAVGSPPRVTRRTRTLTLVERKTLTQLRKWFEEYTHLSLIHI